jgi:hypothetical protein
MKVRMDLKHTVKYTVIPAVLFFMMAGPLAAIDYSIDQSNSVVLSNLFKNLLLPNLPGGLLLLFLSSIFSSINFYSDVPVDRRSLRGAGRYLIAWISANYLFSLFILLLILPDSVSLTEITKPLFVYCLLATALPEVAANLKLQLGESSKAIDLYKYKTRVSGLISDRVENSLTTLRNHQLMSLAYFYFDHLDEFLDRLAVFKNSEELTDDERESVELLATRLHDDPPKGSAQNIIKLESEFTTLAPKLLEYFADDVRSFELSPVASLMKRLYSHLEIEEANKLVQAGVTSETGFLLRCRLPYFRSRLVSSTKIPLERMQYIFYSCRFQRRQRWKNRFAWGISALAVMFVALTLYASIGWKELNSTLVKLPAVGAVVSGPVNEASMNAPSTSYVDGSLAEEENK